MNNQLYISKLPSEAKLKAPEWKKHFVKNKKKIEKADTEIHRLHDEASARIDCLTCGNCCRTLGPRITDKDVERMSKALRMKAIDVISRYLKVDEDGDMVFQSMPCPFLGDDNYCSIYESRPKACREYPHTDRRKFYQIYHLSIKNAETCPIVFDVLEKINQKIN